MLRVIYNHSARSRKPTAAATCVLLCILALAPASLFAEDAIVYFAPIITPAEMEAVELIRVRRVLSQELTEEGYFTRGPQDLADNESLSTVNPSDCNEDCLTSILNQLPADYALVASLTRSGNGYALSLRFFEVRSGRLVPVERQPPVANLPDLLEPTIRRRVGVALRAYFSPETTPGGLASGVEEGVRLIALDGDNNTALRILTRPTDAEIRIQTDRDERNRKIFRVIVQHPGYRSVELTVRPESAGQHTIIVELQRGSEDTGVATQTDTQRTQSRIVYEREEGPHFGAMFLSMLMPGTGQFYKHTDKRGGWILGLFWLAVANAAHATAEYERYVADFTGNYRNDILIAGLNGLNATPSYNPDGVHLNNYILFSFFSAGNRDYIEDQIALCGSHACDRIRRARSYRNYSVGAAALIYLYNVFDALLTDGYVERQVQVGDSSAGRFDYDLATVPDPIGFGQRYQFSARWSF